MATPRRCGGFCAPAAAAALFLLQLYATPVEVQAAVTPAFAAASDNPFGLSNIEVYSAPAFADLDGDGDLDMISGRSPGSFYYFENTGSATSPAFASRVTNPFGLTDIGSNSNPSFADLDNDGDLDLLSGERYGEFFYYFENTVGSISPAFAAVSLNPFGLADIGARNTPALADLDGDGDLDMISGGGSGNFFYFENTVGSPVLSDLESGVSFDENTVNAAPQIIDSDVTFTDDGADLNGGSLTVDYSTGGGGEDQLGIENQGGDPGQIGVSGNTVSYEGNPIGTIDSNNNGSNGDDLIIDFTTANATPAAVENLIEALTYGNTSDAPAASRTIEITVNDGEVALAPVPLKSSLPATVQITVNAENDAPTVTGPGNQTIVRNTSTGPLSVTVGDPDHDPGGLAVTGASNNPTLAPVDSILFGGSGTNRTVEVTPAVGQSGTALITLMVRDSGQNGTGGDADDSTATDTFTLTVQAPGINVTPGSIDMGSVAVNASKDTTAQITNTGDANLDITNLALADGNAGFSLVLPTAPVSPGGDSTVTIRFSSQQAGSVNDTLVITHNADGSPSRMPLSGEGLARGDLDLDGRVSILDLIRNVRIIIGKDAPPSPGTTAFHLSDVDNSGVIDVADVIKQVNIILGIPDESQGKAVAHVPVTVGLGDIQRTGDRHMAIPVILDALHSIAGMQITFTFDPALLEVGTPEPAGPAAGLSLDNHVRDGTLRVVVYRASPDQEFITGAGTVLLIPVKAKDKATATPALTLAEIVLADGQARHVPVQPGATRAEVLPTAFALHGARPNPFNPSTTITYEVPQQAHIQLIVYNLLGQEVIRLVDQPRTPGRYRVTWNGRNTQGHAVASGIYLYRLVSSTGYSESKRVTLLK